MGTDKTKSGKDGIFDTDVPVYEAKATFKKMLNINMI